MSNSNLAAVTDHPAIAELPPESFEDAIRRVCADIDQSIARTARLLAEIKAYEARDRSH